jgi:hypothetical protein
MAIYFRIAQLVARVPKVSSEFNVTGVQNVPDEPPDLYTKTEVTERQAQQKDAHRLHVMDRHNLRSALNFYLFT